MDIDQCAIRISQKFEIVGTIDFTTKSWPNLTEIYSQLRSYHKDSYSENQRIVVSMNHDIYDPLFPAGLLLQSIQTMVNTIDISNYFVEIITTNPEAKKEYQWVLDNISTDTVPVNITVADGAFTKQSNTRDNQTFSKFTKFKSYNTKDTNKSAFHHNLLTNNPSFCMLPWTHLAILPNNKVTPCCNNPMTIGDASKSSLREIWNSDSMKNLRKDMLSGRQNDSCNACYIKEKLGRDSLRLSSNRNFLQYIDKVDETVDGYLDRFELNYVDTRFNNLCNLACRSCRTDYSSSWHEIAVKFGTVPPDQPALLIAGRSDSDIYTQLLEHLDYIDTIYFAGGEPLIIGQFYMLLDELIKCGRTDVKLIYNTNLTKHRYRGRSIFDLWNKFSSVSIGASLDGEYQRGEYLRSNTKWADVLAIRKEMIDQCPHVDFYVSSTITIHNALHLPDFHRSWVNAGLIRPEDYNIQLAFGPDYMRVDSAPPELKAQIQQKYLKHLDWLIPQDRLGRATSGFQSVLNFIKNQRDFDLDLFWNEVDRLDQYHGTSLLEVFPELSCLTRKVSCTTI